MRCGFRPEQIVFTGVGKSAAEIDRAVALGLLAINVESPGELDRIDQRAIAQNAIARVALRVNPDIDAKSHPHISTGLKSNKFGVPIDEAPALFREMASRRGLLPVGAHVHIGSQITTLDPLSKAAEAVVALARDLRSEGVELQHLDMGGGLGISYDGSAVVDPADYVRALVTATRGSGLKVAIEPGRVLVGPAGVLLTTVVDVKQFPGAKRFVVLDAGMTELMRPALYNAFHRIEPLVRRDGADSAGRPRRADLRKHRRLRARSPVPAGGSGRRGGRAGRRRLRRGDGPHLFAAAAAARSADRRRRVARHSPPPNPRRIARARNRMMHRPTGHQANRPSGHLIAFEGLDQSGKQTQAERLLEAFRSAGRNAEFLTFPEYTTAIGTEIGSALQGERDYQPDTLQLLYIANRFEFRPRILEWLAAGTMVVCDRYLASSIAYGEAQGVDAAWLTEIQRFLPQPSLTLLLDIPPEASLNRKRVARDKFERDLPLLGRVRESYLRQAAASQSWVRIEGGQDKDAVSQAVLSAVRSRLGLL